MTWLRTPLLLLLLLVVVVVLQVLSNWSYALFYVVSELWGAVAISVLFWWVRGGGWAK
jgi:ATP/ADP translocase